MGLDFVSAFKNIWILNTELHTVLVFKPQKGTKCIVKHKIHSHNKEKQQNNQKNNTSLSQKVLKLNICSSTTDRTFEGKQKHTCLCFLELLNSFRICFYFLKDISEILIYFPLICSTLSFTVF